MLFRRIALAAFGLAVALSRLALAEVPANALDPAQVLPGVIDRLDVDGTWRTEGFVIPRELPWKTGQSVTKDDWDLGVQRVWNMGVFSRVEAWLEREDEKLVAKVKVEERWTINAITRFGVGGGVGWWALGLTDINTLGRFIETGAYYQRFGNLNCGEAWVRFPRFLDERQDLYVIADRIGRPRQEYTQIRTDGRVEYFKQLSETLFVGGRLELAVDRFRNAKPLTATDSTAVITGGIARFGRVDVQRLFMTGASLELRPSVAITTDAVRHYEQLSLEGLYFRIFSTWLNLALRTQAGYLTKAPYQSAFFIGGLDLVRGLPDSAIRTRLYALANVEARAAAFDSMWFAVMPAVFVDGVVARRDDGSAQAVASVGGGVRLLSPRFVRAGLRVDYAVVLPGAQFDWRRPSIGVWQFF